MSDAKKTWYKTWWGIILTVLFFPFIVPYLVWAKTSWAIWIKILITVVCAVFLIWNFVSTEQGIDKAQVSYDAARIFISQWEFDQAGEALKKSRMFDSSRDRNPAFLLSDELEKYQSEEFLKSTLHEMSDEDFTKLQSWDLKTSFFSDASMNDLFLKKLWENAERREAYLVEQDFANKRQAAAERTELLEEQFSTWDGSHINLTRVIKDAMNDPDSYKHDETVYVDNGDHLIVTTTFRGANAFGGVVKNTVSATKYLLMVRL